MEISAHLHRSADLSVPRKQQAIIKSFAKALEIIPRQLCDNAGFDATNILTQLRVEHRKGNTWAGVDFDNEGVRDNMEAFVWEPSLVKINAVQAATEAACLILSVDETISELHISARLLDNRSVYYWDGEILADFHCRKPGVRATTGAAAGITSWSGAESNERERERDAEEVMVMFVSCIVVQSEHRMYRYHHKALSEFTINKNNHDHSYCRSILHLSLYLRNTERANTRCSQKPRGMPFDMIFTSKQKRHLSRCCASRPSR